MVLCSTSKYHLHCQYVNSIEANIEVLWMLTSSIVMYSIQGYRKRNSYIITQMPMGHTVIDFWRMIYEHNCQSVIMLNPVDSNEVKYHDSILSLLCPMHFTWINRLTATKVYIHVYKHVYESYGLIYLLCCRLINLTSYIVYRYTYTRFQPDLHGRPTVYRRCYLGYEELGSIQQSII